MARALLGLLAMAGALFACSGTTDRGISSRSSSDTPEPTASSLAPTASSLPPAGSSSFSQEILSAHNRWRREYGNPDLVWSDELAAFAREWAQELAPGGLYLRHRPNNPYGENLYAVQGRQASAAEVVDTWGAEEALYDPEQNNWWPKAAHFSQMIWKSTRRLGCAVVRSEDIEHWVCNYDPPGNVHGRKPY